MQIQLPPSDIITITYDASIAADDVTNHNFKVWDNMITYLNLEENKEKKFNLKVFGYNNLPITGDTLEISLPSNVKHIELQLSVIKYELITSTDSPGNDIHNIKPNDIDECNIYCNSKLECSGFTAYKYPNTNNDYFCYFKNSVDKQQSSSSDNTLHIKKNLNVVLNIKSDSLLSVTMGKFFNSQITLPHSLQSLTMGNSFNSQITLPPTLISLTMGSSFDQPITLPPTLISLTMGSSFDQPITLPSTLISLIMGEYFNQKITLPSTLTSLTMGDYFNKQITIPDNFNANILKGYKNYITTTEATTTEAATTQVETAIVQDSRPSLAQTIISLSQSSSSSSSNLSNKKSKKKPKKKSNKKTSNKKSK